MSKFWETTKLSEMSIEQWESLCDGCAKCCLHKLEDEDTKEVAFTWIGCRYLDDKTCRCNDYENRISNVLSCLKITYDNMDYIEQSLPQTCAYKLLYQGKNLPDWHPLITGDPNSVHTAGISISEMAIAESEITLGHIEDFLIEDENF